MRRDYFDRYAASMPTFDALRRRGAWFPHAEVNCLPTNTGVGHSNVSTGSDPRVHGITGVNLFEHVRATRSSWRRAASIGRGRRSRGMAPVR
jgi:predicted AlkP superfamily pyrophosphatase or phosphodiesterase